MSTTPSLPARPWSAWLRWLPLLAWVGFILILFRPGAVGFRWVGQRNWGDKITHFLLIGMLAFLFNYALANRRVRLWRCVMPLAILVMVVFMTAEEVSQIWVPGRNFEWGDLACNYLGIGVAWLASAWLFRPRELP